MLVWAAFPNFSGTSTMLIRKGKLYISSSSDDGVLIIDKIE
jgi:hypothetical protein